MTVVCDGVTSAIVPGLDDSKVPYFNTGPIGPHPCGSFEIWVPQEYLPHMLSFMMFNRGDITVLVHPLGKTEVRDHTVDAMWLGNPYPIGNKDPGFLVKFLHSYSPLIFSDVSPLLTSGGDPPQYPELGLGYSKKQ